MLIDLSLHATVKLLSIVDPCEPLPLDILAFQTLYLSFLYLNQAPGLGFNPLILANIFFAF